MKTHNLEEIEDIETIIETFKDILEDGNFNLGICSLINSWTNTEEKELLVMKFFKDNKPSPVLYNSFYTNSAFQKNKDWWWVRGKHGDVQRRGFILKLIRVLMKAKTIIEQEDKTRIEKGIDHKKEVYPTYSSGGKLTPLELAKAKVKKLIKLFPNIQPEAERLFPELKDTTLFAVSGDLFVRKGYPKGLYALYFEEEIGFYIFNIRLNKDWNHTMLASNSKNLFRDKAFLTKSDFKALLKKSGCKLEGFKPIKGADIEYFHKLAFNEK